MDAARTCGHCRAGRRSRTVRDNSAERQSRLPDQIVHRTRWRTSSRACGVLVLRAERSGAVALYHSRQSRWPTRYRRTRPTVSANRLPQSLFDDSGGHEQLRVQKTYTIRGRVELVVRNDARRHFVFIVPGTRHRKDNLFHRHGRKTITYQ